MLNDIFEQLTKLQNSKKAKEMSAYMKNKFEFLGVDSKSRKIVENNLFKEYRKTENIDFITGIESRGFIFGAALASELKKGVVPIRKAGKLPYTTISQHYALEYGTAKIEMHIDAFRDIKNPRVLLIDDLIATGGTAIASTKLIKQLNAQLVEACFIIDLVGLGGTKQLSKECKIYSVLSL